MDVQSVNALSRQVLPLATPLVLKITLVLLASGLLALAWRRATAASRHLLWTLGIAGVLAMPLVSRLLPSWELALPRLAAQPEFVQSKTVTQSEFSFSQSSIVSQGAAAQRALPVEPSTTTLLDATRGKLGHALRDLSLSSWLLLLWECGALLVGLYYLAGFLRVRSLERRATLPLSEAQRAMAQRVASEIGLTRMPSILRSEEAITPMTWGVRRPILLLPSDCDCWSAEQWRDVLLHELHHVRRRDALTQGMTQLTCALLWFHPLIWLAERCMRREREHACDDQVLMAGSKASSYANHLLEMARSLRGDRRTAFASVAMARRSELSSRLLSVLDPQLRRGGSSRFGNAMLVAIFLLVLLPLAAVKPVADAAEPRPNAPRAVLAPRPAPAALGFGFGRGKSSLHLSEDDDGRTTWKYEDDDERIWVEKEGEVTIKADDFDVESMKADAYFEIGEGRGRKAKHIEFNADGDGKMTRTYFEGRSEKEFDAAAQAWLAQLMPRAVRNLGIDVEERTARIYQRGGVDAFLLEMDEIGSGHVRGLYYRAFLELDGPTATERRSVLGAFATSIEGDYERAEFLLGSMPEFLGDPQLRAMLVDQTSRLEGDYDRSRVLQAALEQRSLSAEHRAALLSAASAIDSDYEVGQVLSRVDAPALADAAVRDAYFDMVDGIESDYERSQILQSLLQRAENDPQLAESILDAVEEVDSSYERSQVLGALIDTASLNKAQQLRLIQIVDRTDSEYERANLLIAMADMEFADEEVRNALVAAVDSIESEHEYGRVMRAIRRGQGSSGKD